MQRSDAPRSRTTVAYLQLQISNIQPRSTLNRNIQPTPPPLEEMQGGTPCPRIAAAHFPLSKNKQRSDRFKQVIGALRSTLKRNAQQRGKRNPLPLKGVQGSDAPPPVPRRGERYGSAGAFLISWPRRAKVNSRIRRAASGQSGWPSSFSTASKGVRGAFMRIRRAPSERT